MLSNGSVDKLLVSVSHLRELRLVSQGERVNQLVQPVLRIEDFARQVHRMLTIFPVMVFAASVQPTPGTFSPLTSTGL